MRVFVASDHAGYELKNLLVSWLREEQGYDVEDMGPYTLEPDDDYPDYVMPLARRVAHDGAFGVVIGFSGQGEAMAANRITGARAAVYYGGPEELLRLSREHNDANILSLGARFITPIEAKEAIEVWLNTDFSSGERHVRRIHKLDA